MFLVSPVVAACGAGAPPESPKVAPAPVVTEAPAADSPTTLPTPDREVHIEDALSELRDAERALDVEMQKPAAPKRPPPHPETHPEARPETRPSDERSCQIACVALASMRRSADYVCKLAGSGDPRCVDASSRARRAEAKVTASCGACTSTPLSLRVEPVRVASSSGSAEDEVADLGGGLP